MLEKKTASWSVSCTVFTWTDYMEIAGQENKKKKKRQVFISSSSDTFSVETSDWSFLRHVVEPLKCKPGS